MAVKPIIIPLVADTAGLEHGVDALEALGKVDSDTANKFKEANKAFKDRVKAANEATSSTDKLASAIDKLSESIIGGATKKGTDDLDKLRKKAKETGAEFEVLKKTIQLAKQQLSTLQQGTPAFDRLSKEIQAAEMAMKNFKTAATSSRGELRQYREALNQLEDAGLEDTRVFQDMAAAAGQLQDSIGDTQARIKALSSDTLELDTGIAVVQGLAGAFSTVQGAAALFGDENEDLQKSLLRVNAAMAVLSGLQQLQNTLQRQSVAVIGLEIAAQRLYTLVVGESTGAMKAFRIALASTGIGLLVIALGALIANFDRIKTSIIGGVSPALRQLSEDKQRVVEAAERAAQASALEERQLKATGATDTEVLKVRIKNTELLIKALQGQLTVEQEVLKARRDAFVKESAFLAANQQTSGGALLSLLGFGDSKEVQEQFQKVEDINNRLKEAQITVQEALKEIQDIGIEESKKAREEALKAIQSFLQDQVAANEAALIEARDGFEKLVAEIALINAKLRLELANSDLGPNERLAAELRAGEEIKKARQNLLGDLQALQSDHNIEITKIDQERILQGAARAQQELEKKRQNAEDQKKITEDRIKKEQELQQRQTEFAIQTAASLAGSITEIYRNNADTQIAIEQQRLEQGLITQEQFDQKSRAIRRRAAQQEKQLALFQAALAQSLAILSILKDQTIPVTAKPLFIALASAQALAQLAAIASKPIPAFKRGTKDAPGGPSLVGEAGAELIYHNGNWQYASKATVLDLPKHAKVIPAPETAQILQKYEIPIPNVSQNVNTTVGQVRIDYQKLGQAVGREVAKLPLQQFSFDENGIARYNMKLAHRNNYLNGKFRSPRSK